MGCRVEVVLRPFCESSAVFYDGSSDTNGLLFRECIQSIGDCFDECFVLSANELLEQLSAFLVLYTSSN